MKVAVWPLAGLGLFPLPAASDSDGGSPCHVPLCGSANTGLAQCLRAAQKGKQRLLASLGRSDSVDGLRLCWALAPSDKMRSCFPAECPEASRLWGWSTDGLCASYWNSPLGTSTRHRKQLHLVVQRVMMRQISLWETEIPLSSENNVLDHYFYGADYFDYFVYEALRCRKVGSSLHGPSGYWHRSLQHLMKKSVLVWNFTLEAIFLLKGA